MKKHLSVFMLLARSTFYKVLGIIILMCGVEFALFSRAVARARQDGNPGLEYAIEKSWLVFVFIAALLTMVYILIPGIGSKKSNPRYTLDRLRISENWIFFWQSLYNILCFALIILVQTAAAIALCHYYVQFAEDPTVTRHTIFLAFYRNDFFHSLLPFDEPASIAANILTVFAMGHSAALCTMAERYKRGNFASFIGAYTMICFVRRDTGDFLNNMTIFILTAVVIIYTVYFLLTKEDRHVR